MQLIEKLDLRQYGQLKNPIRFALFKCPICLKEIEKPYVNGLKQKSCGSVECSPLRKYDKNLDRPRRIHRNMKSRCNNPNYNKYHVYGGKGVKVCEKWDTFEGFWKDMGNTYIDDYTIDRKDSNGNYEPNNCHWISLGENSSKAKRKQTIQINKETGKVVKVWESAREAGKTLGIDSSSIAKVIKGKKKSAGGFIWQIAES